MSSIKECRIGLLGAARITPPAIILPAQDNPAAKLVAIAARDNERARRFAAEHHVNRVVESYQALVEDAELDLIYNALPASEHLPWTMKALAAGKNVLCEKPIALNADEAQDMVELAAAQGCLMIEAFHYRYHPVIARELELLADNAIGEIKLIEGVFNVAIENSQDIRYQKALGGGALMDLGCYPVHWLRTCMGAEPEILSASASVTEADVDISLSGEMIFPSGAVGRIACSMAPGLKMENVLRIQGTDGSLEVINPLVPHFGYQMTLRERAQNEDQQGEFKQDIRVTGKSTYHHQLDAVVELLSGQGTQITGGQDCVNNMRAIDSLYRAAGVSEFQRN